MNFRGSIETAVETKLDRSRIGALWRSVEARGHPSFFLSWHWVGTWIAALVETPDILVATRDGEPVGLMLLGRRPGCWSRLRGPAYHLTSAGDPDPDAPFVEYNGPIVADDAPDAFPAMIGRLSAMPRFLNGWCRIHLPGIQDRVRKQCADSGLRLRDETARGSPFIDLDGLRGAGGHDYLATRSRNFRSQVRRSIRLYGEDGVVRLEPAGDVEDALRAFSEMKTLHQRRWVARGQPGAFASAFFERFHRALIEAAWPSGAIDMLRLRAGETTVGYLYNFVHGGCAYAYQNGFDFSRDARHKPGLVSHALAAQRYLDAGLNRYLLLAGDSAYKNSLRTGSDTLYWSVARRPGAIDAALDLTPRLFEKARGAGDRLIGAMRDATARRSRPEPRA